MTPETIERLAREAGITLPAGLTVVQFATFMLQLSSFAAAARVEALEEAALIADDMDYSPDGAVAKSIRALAAQEKT